MLYECEFAPKSPTWLTQSCSYNNIRNKPWSIRGFVLICRRRSARRQLALQSKSNKKPYSFKKGLKKDLLKCPSTTKTTTAANINHSEMQEFTYPRKVLNFKAFLSLDEIPLLKIKQVTTNSPNVVKFIGLNVQLKAKLAVFIRKSDILQKYATARRPFRSTAMQDKKSQTRICPRM